ncbi:hypothetical protein GGI02_005613 [Coemansia sp. RSA 2322]|nr:hypothetical protein GGI02_005613 [Coemansia sp. RSA 2322]
MWRRILEYCRAGDGSGGGVVSAQSFINRLANAAASHMHEDGYEDGSMSPLAMSSDVGPSADVARSESMASIGGIQRNGILPDAESEDGRAVSDAGKSDFAEPASESAHDPTLGEDDDVESTSAECEYDEEGVVGGSLSQWSIAGIPTDSEDDGDEDALDCLDVDADDM